jgi:DNA-binding MarR family transcriptional regulator
MSPGLARRVAQVLRDYPRIYFACHERHVPDRATGRVLSAHQAGILSHLDEAEPTRLGELARHMGVTLSTMSLSAARLVRQGYVLRERSPSDRRALALRLTPAGTRMKLAQRVLDPERVAALLKRLARHEQALALGGLALLARAAAEELAAQSRGESPWSRRRALSP